MIYFSLLSIRSSQSYDLDHEFCGLTCIDLGRFCCILILDWFFFPVLFFNIKLIENCASLTCFNLLYMWLSQFHDLNHEFDKLTQVDSYHFFSLIYMRLSRYHDPNHEINRLTRADSSWFFNWFVFSISSFKIRLIENWVSWFVLICFIWVIMVS
jgi:hypothetical protein